MGREEIRRRGRGPWEARVGSGRVWGGGNQCLSPVSLCVSVFTSASPVSVTLPPSPQLHLPRIHHPSPGFLSPDPALRPRASLSPPQDARRSETSRGPSSTSGKGWKRRGQGRARNPGNRSPGHPPRPGGREAGGKYAQSSAGPPQEEAGAEPAQALRTGGRPNAPGRPWGGGHREGGCGGGAGGGRRHLGPGEQCAPHHRAAVPMRAPTVLGTHALQCSTPGPTPAPCPGTAARGP